MARHREVAARLAGRAPAKLAATFDYFGAAPWYLHASNAAAFDERAKTALGVVETVVSRLLLLAALVACGRMAGRRSTVRKGVALAGAVAAFTLHGWLGYAAIPVLVALAGGRALARGPVLVPIAAAVIGATAAVHAVFFGAGRYGLVVAPFVALLAFADAAPRDAAVAETRSAGHIGAVDAARAIAGHRRHGGTGGKSELHRARCRVTPGGGNAEESATERKPPSLCPSASPTVRVKGRGKSPPRPRQRGWHGKPHREQGRIGKRLAAASAVAGEGLLARACG